MKRNSRYTFQDRDMVIDCLAEMNALRNYPGKLAKALESAGITPNGDDAGWSDILP